MKMPALLSIPVMDHSALFAAELRDDPYQWAYVRHAIPLDDAACLLSTFPGDGFWRLEGEDEEKSWTYLARPLVTLGATEPALAGALHPAWQLFAQQLCAKEYRQALGSFLGIDLRTAAMEASVWRWDHGAFLGPHLDLSTKVVTQVFYFTVGWSPDQGGCLRILRSQDAGDVYEELAPRLGAATVLVRSDRSWHAVTPVAGRAGRDPRRSLIVTWFHPGADSPVWHVQDGRITCIGGGDPIDRTANIG
jgi:hypothetical protein